MEFEVTEINVAESTVYGQIRGQDLADLAHDYIGYPSSLPCAENMCPVESWTEPDKWLLSFHIKDPLLLERLLSGAVVITPHIDPFNGRISFTVADPNIRKATVVHQPGVCEFCRDQARAGELPPYHDHCRCEIKKSIKCMKVNKNMSTANEIFNQLVEERMAEIRATRSDLSETELREKATAEILEVHPEFASESVEKGVREFQRLVDERVAEVRKSASGPKDLRVLKAVATTEISRERPDLARAVLLAEKIESTMPPKQTVAKAAPQQPMGPAAREMDRLVKSRMGEIRKSAAAPRDEKILNALATAQICKECPELMRLVLNEERTMEARLAYGGRF